MYDVCIMNVFMSICFHERTPSVSIVSAWLFSVFLFSCPPVFRPASPKPVRSSFFLQSIPVYLCLSLFHSHLLCISKVSYGTDCSSLWRSFCPLVCQWITLHTWSGLICGGGMTRCSYMLTIYMSGSLLNNQFGEPNRQPKAGWKA